MIGGLCRRGGSRAAVGRLVRRGLAAFANPGVEASLCHGTSVLADRLLGWVAIQVKADGIFEDGAAIGGAQLPRAQHSAGVRVAPVQCGGDQRGQPGDQRSDLLWRLRKGGRPTLLQQRYGGARFAVGATGFAVTVEGDRGRGGQWIGRRRRLYDSHGRGGHGLSRYLQCSKGEPTSSIGLMISRRV